MYQWSIPRSLKSAVGGSGRSDHAAPALAPVWQFRTLVRIANLLSKIRVRAHALVNDTVDADDGNSVPSVVLDPLVRREEDGVVVELGSEITVDADWGRREGGGGRGGGGDYEYST